MVISWFKLKKSRGGVTRRYKVGRMSASPPRLRPKLLLESVGRRWKQKVAKNTFSQSFETEKERFVINSTNKHKNIDLRKGESEKKGEKNIKTDI